VNSNIKLIEMSIFINGPLFLDGSYFTEASCLFNRNYPDHWSWTT
jgi:hypothetical protein